MNYSQIRIHTLVIFIFIESCAKFNAKYYLRHKNVEMVIIILVTIIRNKYIKCPSNNIIILK